MQMFRRATSVFAVALSVGLSAGQQGIALAAERFPDKPIRLVVPFEAAGTVDAIGRSIATRITQQSGVNVFIDNRPGANSMIGTVEVAKSAPDGYTVLNVSPSFVLNPLIKSKLPYDIFKDFAPVTALGIGNGYLLAVRKDLPAASVAELVALANKSDKPLTYGTPGIGNALHLATEGFAQRVGIKLLHVPYKGSAGALNAITAGQVDVMMLSPTTVAALASAGKVRLIAFTGETRAKEYPNVPTMKESGVSDFVLKGTWVGWFVPAKTPANVIERLRDEARKALADPQVRASLLEGGFEPDGRSPAEFASFVRTEYQRFGEMVKAAHIDVE